MMKANRKTVTKIEELRPVQEERFERQMDMVFEAHPYYMELFKKKKFRPAGTSRALMTCTSCL